MKVAPPPPPPEPNTLYLLSWELSPKLISIATEFSSIDSGEGEGGGGDGGGEGGGWGDHMHEIPVVQLVLGLGSGHWYVLVVWMLQPFGAGSSCGIVPLKELPSRRLRARRGTTAVGEWERGKGWSGEREAGGRCAALGAITPLAPSPLPPHAAGRAAAERGGLTSASAR